MTKNERNERIGKLMDAVKGAVSGVYDADENIRNSETTDTKETLTALAWLAGSLISRLPNNRREDAVKYFVSETARWARIDEGLASGNLKRQ